MCCSGYRYGSTVSRVCERKQFILHPHDSSVLFIFIHALFIFIYAYTHSTAVCSNCRSGYTCVAPNICRKGVELKVYEVTYPNNSVIALSRARRSCTPLACTTDLYQRQSTTGVWYYPNGTLVSINTANGFYISRNDEGAVFLHRQSNTEHPTGHYCCNLPTAIGTRQTMCAEIGQCIN